MKKNIYVLTLFLLVVAFCACQNRFEDDKKFVEQVEFSSKYGSYLAGRVAHVRKDFNTAADYYAKTVEIDKDNASLLSQLYIIYASTGDLEKASFYAQRLKKLGDENSFLDTIIAVDEVKNKKYLQVIDRISFSSTPIYQNFINPLILAWAYAGNGDVDNALTQLKGFENDASLKPLYNFQVAMIYDYFNDTKKAKKYYDKMADEYKTQLSFRALQLMSNFYLRINEKQKAIDLVNLYKDDVLFAPMLNSLLSNIRQTKEKPLPIITQPSLGLAESLFSIAATLRAEGQNVDLAHIFVSMSIYSNPKYDLAKLLLADILEDREMFLEANDVYNTIDESSESYYIVLRKKASNLIELGDYEGAQKILFEVVSNDPNDLESYMSLANSYRENKDFENAIKYYQKAISSIKKVSPAHWVLYYSIGTSYEKNNQWDEAQEPLLTALKLSNDHYLVQNYLGYIWLDKNHNSEQALALIIDAYRQAPNDGNIADSLGYAFYKFGFYKKAIKYLEEAVLLEPNNPIIFEHLGDAYYMEGRRNEALFQWNHALFLKDKGDAEFVPEEVVEKIKSGMSFEPLVVEDKEFVADKIKELGQ